MARFADIQKESKTGRLRDRKDLVADLAALYWVGLWANLTAKNPARATANHVLLVLIVPWVVFGLVTLTASVLSPDLGDRYLPMFFLALWFGLGLAADFGFGAWARHKLLTEFRLAATRRYETPPGFWRRMLDLG